MEYELKGQVVEIEESVKNNIKHQLIKIKLDIPSKNILKYNKKKVTIKIMS